MCVLEVGTGVFAAGSAVLGIEVSEMGLSGC